MATFPNDYSLEPMTTEDWLAWAVAFGERIAAKRGPNWVESVELLHEEREERMDALMGEEE